MKDTRTRALLDEARGVRAMTWVIAIMLFLTLLAAAAAMATGTATAALDARLAGRLTVQVVADDAGAERALAALRASRDVARAAAVPPAELAALVAPWLGGDASDLPGDLPMPVLIEVDLADVGDATATRVAAIVTAAAPRARIDRQASWLAPVRGLLAAVRWLALALVGVMTVATVAVVTLAARAGLDAHRATIEVMHVLGATDAQVARLFQRRMARDAALGGAAGGVAAAAVIALLAARVAALGSELLGGATLGATGWIALAAIPLAFVALAAITARLAVTRALGRLA